MPMSFMEWITYAGLIIPLAALAWSAWQYVNIKKREIERYEYKRIFEVLNEMGAGQTSPASKMVAAYELRSFPKYRDVIIRLCDMPISGPSEAVQMWKNELQLTKKFFEEN